MKKALLIAFAGTFLFATIGFSQNVGIGTTTPTSKLEVRNPVKADLKLRTDNFGDTTLLQFINRNLSEQGTDFNLRSIAERGLFISSNSDLPNNTSDSSMIITPQGRVGIGTLPQISAQLDLKSTTRGILIPRMTTAQRNAIGAPATGLLVFDNTTESFWFRSTTGWTEIVHSSGSLSQIRDSDNDTRVQTEKNPDDDTIRFVSKGFELARMTSKTLHMDTAGSVYIGNFAGQSDGGVDNIGNSFTGNVAIGRWAGQFSVNGSNNVYIGYGSGRYELGKWNTFIGYNAGNRVLSSTNNSNTLIGRYAGGSSSGNDNIQIGTYAGAYNDGDDNIFIGNSSGGGSFVGSDRGSNNVVLGHSAGAMNIFGSSGNVLIGNNVAQTDTFSNRLFIHNGASDSTTALIYGKFDSSYLKINGDLKVKNEVHVPARTGFSNMVPICYGNVNDAGGINSGGSGNFTVTKLGIGFYAITITGEAYQFQSYVTMATPASTLNPRIIGSGSGGGQLYIKVYDAAGISVDEDFHFVVYKK